MSSKSPKINKVKQLIQETFEKRHALLKEGEEFDYDQLEEELVTAVTKAMMPKSAPTTPSPKPLNGDPADKDPNQWRQMPTTQAKPISEDGEAGGDMGSSTGIGGEGQGVTDDTSSFGHYQYYGPLLTTRKKPHPLKRMHSLKESLAMIETTHGKRYAELLEQRNAINMERQQLRQKMEEAKEAAMCDHMDIYEACARHMALNTEEKDWKNKVTEKLRESKML